MSFLDFDHNRKEGRALEKVLELISKEVGDAFEAAGYDRELGRATLSNRPDLCEYQCNGAMAGAKKYGKAPFMIADEVAEKLGSNEMFEKVESVKPGFLNITVSGDFARSYIVRMLHERRMGVTLPGHEPTYILDYGGANVAKPLHVGHLRPAIIGEAVKRILKYTGHKVIGDIHMGDWGLQMGLIITELKCRHPELPYFDPEFTGAYPKESPFTIEDLAEIYPAASAKSKAPEDASEEQKAAADAYKKEALEATKRMQDGDKAYRAIWHHIMNVSLPDLKKNYDSLDVHFDLWKGESDVHDVIPGMVDYMKQHGYAHESQGALVVDVAREDDAKEIPPCMILKSDGAALYATTDLATIQERMKQYHPDAIYYFTYKRQSLHFEQVFRAAKKTKLALPETDLKFIGNGTINGPDGKPFKTRDGGVMHLETLVQEVGDKMYDKIKQSNPDMPEDEARSTAKKVALSALKYGDLSNQAAKDYIFDIDRFTSFEGDTGPYILYTMVRIKSILKKYEAEGGDAKGAKLGNPDSPAMKSLMLLITRFSDAIESAAADLAPNKVCAYIYDLGNAFNSFYHGTRILAEEDASKKESYIALLSITLKIFETCIDMLVFTCPEKM